MLIDKEYPATHSMETSWFVIDEDDNVALFEGAENGPVANGMRIDQYIDELIFRDGVQVENGEKYINFSDEQALYWLDSLFEADWISSAGDSIVQIDTTKKDEFLSYKPHSIRLNEKYGLYYFDDNYLPNILFEKNIVLKVVSCPYWNEPLSNNLNHNQTCPFFLYENDCSFRFPFVRANIPVFPMKASQLSPKQLKQSVRISAKFREKDKIQVMSLYPCYSEGDDEFLSKDGYPYIEVYESSGESIYALNQAIDIDDSEGIKSLKKVPLTLPVEKLEQIKSE